MRRRSYLSRIARACTEDGTSLTPARVLFRPSPIPDGHGAEAPAISPAGVTPAESRSGGHPSELPLAPSCDTDVPVTRNLSRAHLSRPVAESSSMGPPSGDPSELTGNVTVPSTPLVPVRDTGAFIAPKLPLAPLSCLPGVKSSSTVTPQVSGSMPASNSALSLSAKPGPGVSASVEPQFGVARDQAAPARPGRHPKAPRRSSNEALATFGSSSLDMMGPRQASQHRPANVTDSATGQTAFPAAPVSKRASETSPTLLIPPPPAGAEQRATVNMETGSGLHIGALEVRIVPPPPVTPPAPAAFLRQPGPSRPHVALSRGFRSFGLTQA